MNRIEAEQIVKSIANNADKDCANVLKHCFGKSFDEDMNVKELIAIIKATNLSSDSYNINAAFSVATMYYAVKGKQGEVKLQTLLSGVYHDPNASTSLKMSIEELLISKESCSERFVSTLKRLVIAAKIDSRAIDYVSLLMDLANWSDYAYRNWANEILIYRKESED